MNACNRTFNATSKLGYCTAFCRVGGLASATGVRFAGECPEECTTDDECAPLNAKCTASGGLAAETCKPS